jgi:hypothetical protein
VRSVPPGTVVEGLLARELLLVALGHLGPLLVFLRLDLLAAGRLWRLAPGLMPWSFIETIR